MTKLAISCDEFKITEAKSFDEVQSVWDALSTSYPVPLSYSIADYSSYLRKLADRATTLYAVIKGEIAGAISFYSNDTSSRIGYISQLAVSNRYKRCGLGAILLDRACTRSIDDGMHSIALEVLDNNSAAIAFYLNYGFRFTEEHGRYGSLMMLPICPTE